jgi:glucose 1-dehydrogenase
MRIPATSALPACCAWLGVRHARPDQVRLRMLDIGICGTDKEICSFEYGTPPPGDDHLVIGHESVAEIVEVGSAVERLGVGDLVVPSVRRPCPHPGCLACRSGHQDYCYTGDFGERGIKEAHGYMTEYVVDRERYMTLMPPDMRRSPCSLSRSPSRRKRSRRFSG